MVVPQEPKGKSTAIDLFGYKPLEDSLLRPQS